MEHRPFGQTGLDVSAVGFGCWEIGGGYGSVEATGFERAVGRQVSSALSRRRRPDRAPVGVLRLLPGPLAAAAAPGPREALPRPRRRLRGRDGGDLRVGRVADAGPERREVRRRHDLPRGAGQDGAAVTGAVRRDHRERRWSPRRDPGCPDTVTEHRSLRREGPAHREQPALEPDPRARRLRDHRVGESVSNRPRRSGRADRDQGPAPLAVPGRLPEPGAERGGGQVLRGRRQRQRGGIPGGRGDDRRRAPGPQAGRGGGRAPHGVL